MTLPREIPRENRYPCPGPLVWFDSPGGHHPDRPAAILECASCTYIVIAPGFHNQAHSQTPLMREGMAA